jgi:DNA polymerase-4
LPPLYDKYEEFSIKAREIYHRYTDMVEPFGMDECWLDVTGSNLLFGDGQTIAKKIMRDIKNELGITASVGVSFNKSFAKLGSDMKKPEGLTVISKENFKEKIYNLPISDLLFVGNSTANKLCSRGIFSIGDITLASDDMLNRILGKNGIMLKRSAMGLDDSPVITPKSSDRPKSVGRSRTLSEDFESEEEVFRELLFYGEEIAENLREKEIYATGVTLIVRDTDLKTNEYAVRIDSGTQTGITLARVAMKLFEQYGVLPCRSVGLRAIKLKEGDANVQLDMFGSFDDEDKLLKIERNISEICARFGKNAVVRGSLLFKNKNLAPGFKPMYCKQKTS